MKTQLAKLLPVLEGFKVRVDDNGQVLDKPKNYDDWAEESTAIRPKYTNHRKCDRYNQAKEVIRMPRVMDYIDSVCKLSMIGGRGNTRLNFIWIYTEHLKLTPQLSHYVPCGEDGKPLERPENHELFLTMEIHELNRGFSYRMENEQYQAAQSKVIFSGWEEEHMMTNGGQHIILNTKNQRLAFDNGECFCLDGLKVDKQITNYEDAFIHCAHYVDFSKAK